MNKVVVVQPFVRFREGRLERVGQHRRRIDEAEANRLRFKKFVNDIKKYLKKKYDIRARLRVEENWADLTSHDGNFSLYVKRDDFDNEIYIYGCYLPDELQGKGIGVNIIKNLIKFAELGGYKAVALTAAHPVGVYAWALMGFDFSSEKEKNRVVEEWMQWLKKRNIVEDRNKFQHSWDIATYTKNEVKLGKQFLFSIPGWTGKLTVDRNSLSRKIFDAYVENRKMKYQSIRKAEISIRPYTRIRRGKLERVKGYFRKLGGRWIWDAPNFYNEPTTVKGLLQWMNNLIFMRKDLEAPLIEVYKKFYESERTRDDFKEAIKNIKSVIEEAGYFPNIKGYVPEWTIKEIVGDYTPGDFPQNEDEYLYEFEGKVFDEIANVIEEHYFEYDRKLKHELEDWMDTWWRKFLKKNDMPDTDDIGKFTKDLENKVKELIIKKRRQLAERLN